MNMFNWKKFRKQCENRYKRSRYDSRHHCGRKVDGCRSMEKCCKAMNCPLLCRYD